MNDSQSLLQRFFDASLIPSETTDERLRHYQAAASDLAKRFGANLSDAVSASRVAIDPNCPATDPWFNTVQDAVKVHWKTFLVKNHDTPRQICRAILLEALSKTAENDWPPTLAVWNGASSLLPHLGNGPEQAITREFISKLGDECEDHSSEQWDMDSVATDDLPEFEIKLPTAKAGQVDEAELQRGLSDASGPQDQQGNSHGNPNPRWPNSGETWSYQFAPRAANTVATSVNKALASTSPLIEGLSKQLAPAMKKYASAFAEWAVGLAKRNERHTSLLWWKQTLYSPSLKRSYRGLSPTEVAIALSFDLGTVSGAPVPLSVEYLLRETIHNVLPNNPELNLEEIIAATRDSEEISPCLPTAPSGTPRRVSLREFLAVVRQSAPPDETISSYVGILPSTSLPISEWAVWLLRERLADILTTPDA